MEDDEIINYGGGSKDKPQAFWIQGKSRDDESPSPKYFTPSIEDIRVGYEHEWLDSRTDWKVVKVECPHDIMTAFDDIPQGRIRVPYLTKEQIEAEGWESVNEPYWEHKKGHMKLLYNSSEKILQIMNLDFSRETTRKMGYPNDSNFKGKCKDINTFRYICKLLGI